MPKEETKVANLKINYLSREQYEAEKLAGRISETELYMTPSGGADIPTSLSDLTDDSTHRLVTDTEKSTWNGKQNSISDLSTIRSGAALGATALQSFTETDPTVPNWAKQNSKPSYTADEVGAVPTTRKINGETLDHDLTISGLPDVTSADNGKALTVQDGSWAVGSVITYKEV